MTDSNGNPRISTHSVSPQAAVQSGQTVLLGSLIKQGIGRAFPAGTRLPAMEGAPDGLDRRIHRGSRLAGETSAQTRPML
jgi:hypothetical protein